MGGSKREPSGNSGPGNQGGGEALVWQMDVPLLTHGFILRQTAKFCMFTTLALLPVFWLAFVAGQGRQGWLTGSVFALAGGVLLFLCAVIGFLILGNRYPMAFRVDADGVGAKVVYERAKRIHRLAVWLALLLGKPKMAGAGLVAMADEHRTVAWKQISRVRCFPAWRVIVVKGEILQKAHLFCTSENYDRVCRVIGERTGGAVKTG